MSDIVINGNQYNAVETISVNTVDGGTTTYTENKTIKEDIAEIESKITELQTSVNSKASTDYVDTKVADLVNSAPDTLDTLGELANAFQENEDVVEALNNSITNKADKSELFSGSYNDLSDNPTIGIAYYESNQGFQIKDSSGAIKGIYFKKEDFSTVASGPYPNDYRTFRLKDDIVRGSEIYQEIAGTKNFTGSLQKSGEDVATKTFVEESIASLVDKDISVNEIAKEFVAGYSSEEVSHVRTWNKATSPTDFTQRQRACVYGNGYYVIAGTAGQLAYSQDAITWTSITPFSTNVITGLAYGNGYFLAVDSGGNIYRTDIPSNEWTLVYTNPIIIESIRYINNNFCAVGASGFIAVSVDGVSWKQSEVSTTNTFIDIGYGKGKYIAVGQAGTVFTSVNGSVWYDKTIADYTTDIRAIMYANGQFVIGTSGGRIDYSEDGETWIQANNPSSLTIAWIRNFTYYANRLYAVMYASNGQGEIWASKDKGKTWSVEFTPEGTSRLWCVSSGEDKFITSGDGGAIYVLDLGLQWQNQPIQTGYEWYRIKISQNDGSVILSDIYFQKKPEIPTSFAPEMITVEGIVYMAQTLEPNKFYKITGSEINSLNISFGTQIENVLNEYMFEFTAGDVFASLNMPEGVVWLGGETPTFTAGKTYQVSVVNNLAVIGEF